MVPIIEEPTGPIDGDDPTNRCIAWGLVIQQLLVFVSVPVVRRLWRWLDVECRTPPLGRPWWTNPLCYIAIVVNVIVWVVIAVIALVFTLVCRQRASQRAGT
jgi:hypothetical protein